MGASIPVKLDIQSKRFGHLVALEPVKKPIKRLMSTCYGGRKVLKDSFETVWKCQCDCGNISYTRRCNLTRGVTTSCGCMKTSHLKKFIDHTGERHGTLTVIRRDLEEQKAREAISPFWLCKCDCGREISVDTTNLKRIKSCGYHPCRNTKKAKDLTGQKFNKLLVIKRDYDYEKLVKGKQVYWMCKCDCGNITTVNSFYLRHGRIKSCGCLPKGRHKKN